MASIWHQKHGMKRPEKLFGGLPPGQALAIFNAAISNFRSQGFHITVHGHDILIFRRADDPKNGVPAIGGYFVELMSPPSNPDPGDRHRMKDQSKC